VKKTKEEPFEPPYVRPGDGSAIWHDAPEGFVPGTHMWYAREGPGDGLFLPPEHVVIGSHQAFFGLVPVVAAGPDVRSLDIPSVPASPPKPEETP
jgi:hypothetical protein